MPATSQGPGPLIMGGQGVALLGSSSIPIHDPVAQVCPIWRPITHTHSAEAIGEWVHTVQGQGRGNAGNGWMDVRSQVSLSTNTQIGTRPLLHSQVQPYPSLSLGSPPPLPHTQAFKSGAATLKGALGSLTTAEAAEASKEKVATGVGLDQCVWQGQAVRGTRVPSPSPPLWFGSSLPVGMHKCRPDRLPGRV